MFSKAIIMIFAIIALVLLIVVLPVIWLSIRKDWRRANMNAQLRELPRAILG